MLRSTFTLLLSLVLASAARAQLTWTLDPALNAGLPAGVSVYETNTELAPGVPTHGVYVRARLDDPALTFASVLAGGAAQTPLQLADQHFDTFRDSVYVAINGGFFSATQSLSLAIDEGRLLAPNVRALTRPFDGRDTTYFPTRGAFGIRPDRRAELGWVYTTLGDSTYVYPQPAPLALGAAPLPRPGKDFPNGARLWEVTTAVGGAPVLVEGGRVRITAAEELIDVENDSRQPRSAIGYTAAGELLLVAIDGRQFGVASGVTLAELAQIMLDLGAVAALNLDGGGSTGLVVNRAVANRPSDATGLRPVRSAFLIKKNNRVLDTELAANYSEPLGAWGETSNGGFYGSSRARITPVATPATRSARYTFTGIAPGRYRLGAWWVAASNRATNTPYVLQRAGLGAPDTVRFDQSRNGARFNPFVLGDGTAAFELSAADTLTVFNAATGSGAAAFATVDAIKLERVGEAAPLELRLQRGRDSFALGRLDTLRATVAYASANSGVTGAAYRTEFIGADGTVTALDSGTLPQNLRDSIPLAIPVARFGPAGTGRLRVVVRDGLGRETAFALPVTVLGDVEVFFAPDNADSLRRAVESSFAQEVRLRRLVPAAGGDTLRVTRTSPLGERTIVAARVFRGDSTFTLRDTIDVAIGQRIDYRVSVRRADGTAFAKTLTVTAVDDGPQVLLTGTPPPTFVTQSDTLTLAVEADSRRQTVALQTLLLRKVSRGDTVTVATVPLSGRTARVTLPYALGDFDLGPGALVVELVRADGRRASQRVELVVGPARGDTRMVVISDFNSAFGSVTYGWEVDSIVQRIPRLWQPDMVVSGGDMIAGQSAALTPEQVDAMWAGFDRAVATPIRAAGIPFVFTIGNHDGAIPVDIAAAERYWNAPGNFPGWIPIDTSNYPFYQSFYGDSARQTFFIAWNASDATLSAEELSWVEAQLASPAARAARHRFVVGHLPLYASSNERNSGGNILNDSERLRALLEANDVHTYISGHHHAFYPAKRGALELLNAGAAGSGPRSWIGLEETSPNTVTVVDIFGADNPRYGRDTLVYTTYETRYRDARDMPVFDDERLPRVMFSFNGQYQIRRDLELSTRAEGRLSAFNLTEGDFPEAGSGPVTIRDAGDGQIRVEGTFANLRGRLLPERGAVAIYQARHGEQGALVATLDVRSDDGRNGSFGASLPAERLSAELLTVGAYYVAIRTEAAPGPGGEVRTQLYGADNRAPAAVTFADTLARGVAPIRDAPAVLVQEWRRATDGELDPVTYFYQAALDSAFNEVVYQGATNKSTRFLLTERELYGLIGERGRGDSLVLYRRVVASDGRNLNFGSRGRLTLVRSAAPIVGDITLPALDFRYDCTAGRDEFTGECLAAFAKTGSVNGHGVAVDRNSRVWAAAFSGGMRVTNPDGTPYRLSHPSVVYNDAAVPFVTSIVFRGDTIAARNIRGLGRAADGNVLVVVQNSRLVKFDAVTGEVLRLWGGPTSLSNPTTDSLGRTLVVSVVGNRAFLLRESAADTFTLARPEFALADRPSVIRAAALSHDGTTVFLPSNGGPGVQRYVFTADTGYALVDTIPTDNSSNSITTAPGGRVYSVSNRGSAAPKLTFRRYGTDGQTFAWELPLDAVASTDLRGLAFTPGLDTFYVVNSTNGDVQRYVLVDGTTQPGGSRGPAVSYTIPDVRPNDDTGRNLLSGRRVRLRGAVTSANQVPYGLSFYLAELGAGIQVYSDSARLGYVPTVGDSLEVTGVLRQLGGQLQLRLDSLRVIGKATQGFAAQGGAVEASEGYFVALDSVRLRDSGAWRPGGFLGFVAALEGRSADSLALYVGRQTALYDLPAPRGRFRVRGILDQDDPAAPFTSGYLVRPLTPADVELYIEPTLTASADSACAGAAVTLRAATGNEVGNGALYTFLRDGQVLAEASTNPELTVATGDADADYSVRVRAAGTDLRYGYVAADSTEVSPAQRIRSLARPTIQDFAVVGDTTVGSNLQLVAAAAAGAQVTYYAPSGAVVPDGRLSDVQLANSGVYRAVATAANGCVSDTARVRLTVVRASALGEFAGEEAFEVYPNPVTTGASIKLSLPGAGAITAVEFVDAAGRVVLRQRFSGVTAAAVDAVVPAAAGVYVVRLETDRGTATRVLTVE